MVVKVALVAKVVLVAKANAVCKVHKVAARWANKECRVQRAHKAELVRRDALVVKDASVRKVRPRLARRAPPGVPAARVSRV